MTVWRIRQLVYYAASLTGLVLATMQLGGPRTIWQLIAACWCLASFVQPTWNEAARVRNSLLAVSLLFLGGCTSPDAPRQALEAIGFTDITLDGDPWTFACGDDDLFAWSFTAKGVTGKRARGHVCCGAFKGCTVRF